MLSEVIICTVRNAPQLSPAEREHKFKVGSSLGVEAELLGRMVTQAEVLLAHTEREQPIAAEAAPVLEPLEIGTGFAEELKLHLLKFTDAEDKVTGSYLVTE